MGKRLTAEEAARIEHAPVVRGSWIYCAKCSASLTEDSPPCTIRSDKEVADLASTVVALDADLAALRIEHEAHAALLSLARRDRDEARARIAVLEEEQRRDLADVEHFRTMARGYMDERDEARVFIAREGYQPCTSAACNCGAWHKATP